MRLLDLAALYLVVGAACAVALYRREPRGNRAALVNALTAVPLWPLWAPIAWTARRESPPPEGAANGRVEHVRLALEEAVQSVAGTPLERLLDRAAAQTILAQAERVSSRHAELVRLLSREEFNPRVAEERLEGLAQKRASGRVTASARLHLENVRRLHHLADRDARALEELTALVVALRTELMVVRLSGSSAAGVDDIVSDLWAHIEGLRQVSEEALSPAARYSGTPA